MLWYNGRLYLNYILRFPAKGFLGMVFYDTFFYSVLYCFICEMYQGERMDFKNRHYSHVTSCTLVIFLIVA